MDNTFQLIGNIGRFREIWACDFEFQGAGEDSIVSPGNPPRPVCMVAEELFTGRQIRLWRDEFGPKPPFNIGDDALFVSFSAAAEFSCFIVLGWPKPFHILDLYVEFIAMRNGNGGFRNPSLLEALSWFRLRGIGKGEKTNMRDLIIKQDSWNRDQIYDIFDYCYTDVEAIRVLMPAMIPYVERPVQALLRGDYMWAVAQMEHNGIPFNHDLFYSLRDNWSKIQSGLIVRIDRNYGVYRQNADASFSFNTHLFEQYLIANDIDWPVLDSGELETTDEVFEERSKVYPQLLELRYLREALGKMRLFHFPVGDDGLNRSWLNPFGSRTGRNQPSSARFIFGASSWMRHIVQPPPGFAIAYIDWSNQEFAIGAYLSGDPAMIAAYESKDPYIFFAKYAGAIPKNAIPPGSTKTDVIQEFFESWDDVRSLYKTCVLGTQYFVGQKTLSKQIGKSLHMAKELLDLHRELFHVYWHWIEDRIADSFEDCRQETTFGWPVQISDSNCNYNSVGNFFCQGNGAECMRLAAIRGVAEGIYICCPVHDAFLIMAPTCRIEKDTKRMQEIMSWASSQVLDGPVIRTDAKIYKYPRFFNKVKKKARSMWHKVRGELKAL